MEKEEIKELVKDWVDSDYLEYLDEAIDLALQENKKVFRRLIVNHYRIIDVDKLFSEDINVTIKYLQSLREEGYTSISQEWSGYESNYFQADKYEEETLREYAIRLAETLNRTAMYIEERKQDIQEKNRKINELQKEIDKLRSEINKN